MPSCILNDLKDTDEKPMHGIVQGTDCANCCSSSLNGKTSSTQLDDITKPDLDTSSAATDLTSQASKSEYFTCNSKDYFGLKSVEYPYENPCPSSKMMATLPEQYNGNFHIDRASLVMPWGHMCSVVSTMPLLTLFACLATCLFFDTAHINDTVCQVCRRIADTSPVKHYVTCHHQLTSRR